MTCSGMSMAKLWCYGRLIRITYSRILKGKSQKKNIIMLRRSETHRQTKMEMGRARRQNA